MILKVFFASVLFGIFATGIIEAKTFTIATYNVENLFDLKYDKTEYREFIPNTKKWNKEILEKKLTNISFVINNLNPDIIALQEIESKTSLLNLMKRLPQFKYFEFNKNPKSAIGLGILSKYKLSNSKAFKVNNYNPYSRDILKITATIENKNIDIYINHWKSKRTAESTRIYYASSLKKAINLHSNDDDYVLVGDFNENYNEYITFKYDKNLNDTHGITGLNHIINTVYDENLLSKYKITTNVFDNNYHYNLWLDLPFQQRFSYKYRSTYDTPDNIIISKGLLDNKNISYVSNSFRVYRPDYLYKNNTINKKDYSDHLPIIASFSTQKQEYNFLKQHKKITPSIDYLYKIQQLTNPIKLQNIVVVYKSKNHIVLQQNEKAIVAFKCANDLKLGFTYDIIVDKIDSFNGLKEIVSMVGFEKKSKINVLDFYLDGSKIDLQNYKYQNNIINNLNGIYKKNYLYYKDKKIRLYFDKKIKKPKNNTKITINSGHLGVFLSKVQIIIHKKSDIKYD